MDVNEDLKFLVKIPKKSRGWWVGGWGGWGRSGRGGGGSEDVYEELKFL